MIPGRPHLSGMHLVGLATLAALLSGCRGAEVAVGGPVMTVTESVGAGPWLYAGLMGFFLLALLAGFVTSLASADLKKPGSWAALAAVFAFMAFLVWTSREELTALTLRVDGDKKTVECSWKSVLVKRGRVQSPYDGVNSAYLTRDKGGKSGLDVFLRDGTRCSLDRGTLTAEQASQVREFLRRELGVKVR